MIQKQNYASFKLIQGAKLCNMQNYARLYLEFSSTFVDGQFFLARLWTDLQSCLTLEYNSSKKGFTFLGQHFPPPSPFIWIPILLLKFSLHSLTFLYNPKFSLNEVSLFRPHFLASPLQWASWHPAFLASLKKSCKVTQNPHPAFITSLMLS